MNEYFFRPAEPDSHDHWDSGYNRGFETGLEEAWKYAKRIGAGIGDGGMTFYELKSLFGVGMASSVFSNFTVTEVAEKFKTWEAVENIHVGDEILNRWGTRGIVVQVSDGAVTVFWRNAEKKHWKTSIWLKNDIWKKTGKHFEQMVELVGSEGIEVNNEDDN